MRQEKRLGCRTTRQIERRMDRGEKSLTSRTKYLDGYCVPNRYTMNLQDA